ncbi:MAG TPA: hypothetical protein DIT16_09100 [Clostridium sp.]|nr:hypothetical protein [Clostridium sp.]
MEKNKELINKAIEKLNSEMDKEDKKEIRVIGEFLLNQVTSNEDIAKAILTEGKTIMKSLDDMKGIARQRAINGCAVIDPEEGFEIVMNYFGINKKIDIKNSETKVVSINDYKEKSTLEGIDINLDDILDNL